jgi:transposase InsO family protein
MKKFLTLVDRFSGFIMTECITKMTTKAVIAQLDKRQQKYHFITMLESSGGPCYKSQEFKDYCRRVGIKHNISSAYSPQSDGLSEAAVGACEKLFKKTLVEKSRLKVNLAMLMNRPQAGSPGHT